MSRPLGLLSIVCATMLLAARAEAHDSPNGIGLVWAGDDPFPVLVTNRGLIFALQPTLQRSALPGASSEQVTNEPEEGFKKLLWAPSAPQRVYASGVRADEASVKAWRLASSVDEALTWHRTAA